MKHFSQIQNEFLKCAANLKSHVMKYFIDPQSTAEDNDFHAYAAKIGVDKHQLEDAEHSIMKSFIGKGRYNEIKDKNPEIDPDELAMGIKVEMEHTSDPEIAKRIALDHLVEVYPKVSHYYTYLKKMEKQLEDDAAKQQ
ncbi:MAG: DUF5661 family protein [Nitrosarchaeum sp.]|nr:DUF5661 family protein [Nitrosarchaeum sp.]